MAIQELTLETDKRISSINEDKIIIRQSERGLVLTANIIKPDGTRYDLTNYKVQYAETKDGDKAVVDENVQIDSTKQGVVHYTLNKNVYSASGEGWFEIIGNQGTVVDTTQNFEIDVMPEASINVSNDNYISSLEAFTSHMSGAIQRADDSVNEAISDLKKQCSDYIAKYDGMKDDLQKQIDSIESKANSDVNAIKTKSDAQLKSYQDQLEKQKTDWTNQSNQINADYKKQMQDAIADIQAKRDNAIAQVTADRDSAIKTAQTDFNNKLSDLQKDYDAWKVKTVADFNATVDPIKKQIEGNAQNLDSVNKKLDETNQAIAKAEKDFASVNFNDFVKSTDVYSKSDIDAKVAAAGKVKTVNKIQPDANGNISIPQPDLSPYAKTADVNNLINQINGSRLPVYIGKSTDDLFSFKTSQIRKYTGGSGIKNNPFDASAWFTAIYLIEDNAGGGNVVAMDTKGNIYNCGLNSGTYGKWTKISNQTDLNNLQTTLQNSINGKADKSTTYTKTDIDNKVSTINSSLNTKASKTDVSNLQNKLTAVETTANEAKTAASNVKTFIPISQADYDKLTDDQKKNGWYAIG